MAARISLDRIDRKILRILQADARITNQALAADVGLSSSACLARVRRLEQTGVIQGYHARLDPFRVDVGLVLFVEVALEGRARDEEARFEAAIETFPQIVEASHVGGDVDYILKIVVSDMSEWARLRESFLAGNMGIGSITTHVLIKKPRIFTGYPVREA